MIRDFASAEELAAIVDSAIRLRIPPLFLELLMNKLHELSDIDARLLMEHFDAMKFSHAALQEDTQKLVAYWEKLALILDGKLEKEAERIKEEYLGARVHRARAKRT